MARRLYAHHANPVKREVNAASAARVVNVASAETVRRAMPIWRPRGQNHQSAMVRWQLRRWTAPPSCSRKNALIVHHVANAAHVVAIVTTARIAQIAVKSVVIVPKLKTATQTLL
jgi:hypothetical protein